ncbi:hypothetical protein [Alteromonas sp. C1M14]|uniref:hypothetical protein n=1 Tax=Alteromonas sp. C1M14 TaxID=2841567 RepID=UPI001C0A3B5B|nr:hypothetical protein [Alteromonas sp. C1M14]MBU2978123.1 hypothetical protein [Alteromonas sp. C1M14]
MGYWLIAILLYALFPFNGDGRVATTEIKSEIAVISADVFVLEQTDKVEPENEKDGGDKFISNSIAIVTSELVAMFFDTFESPVCIALKANAIRAPPVLS